MKQASEVVDIPGRRGMFWTERCLVDRQCSLVEWPRLGKVPLALN
jgi:hypothetical protein